MWTRRSALPRKLLRLIRSPVAAWSGRFSFFLFFLVFFTLPAPPAHADETIICAVTVNQQKKGEFFVITRDDGDFLILPEDLRQMGITAAPAEAVAFDGGNYVSLRSVQDVTFRFDESTLTLELTAAPELLGKNTVDLRYRRSENVYYPRETSFFVNYGVDYTSSGESSLEFEGFNVSNEIGFRRGNGLFLSDALYSETPEESQWVRLNTRLIWDWRDEMRRFTVGDFIADSGSLGGRVNLGGVSFSKLYQLNPYFIRYPLFDFSGMLDLPADVDLYVDGSRVRTERFAPGEFELQNFQGIRGAQTVEVVIRDAFGREQRFAVPIYATEQILSHGLHEYSYNLGYLRRDFGIESNDYDHPPAFSAFHRYGLTDRVNLGGRAEFAEDLGNVGVESAFIVGNYGLATIGGSLSLDHDDSGAAGQLTYEYQTPRFNARMGVQSYSADYRTLGDLESPADRKLNFFASASYLTAKLGSFGIRYLEARHYQEPDRSEVTFSWSRRLPGRTYLSTSVSLVDEVEQHVDAFVNLNWYFGRDRTLTAGYRRDDKVDTHALEARQNTPAGYGTGWSLKAERTEGDTATTDRLDGFVQHNARHAIVRADAGVIDFETETTTTTRLALSGALVYVGETFGLTRPVRDSFSLVSIGNAENVRVYVNGQDSGRTNRDGRLIVPDLSSYYENRVSFEDKDIPLDYLMPQILLNVSPPLRSGSCINFPLKRYQAFSGTLLTRTNGATTPLADAEIELQSPYGPVVFWTGSDGEFYLDSQLQDFDILAVQGCTGAEREARDFLPAGNYPVTVKHAGDTFPAELNIPASAESYTELGTITLSGRPAAPAPAEEPHLPSPVTSAVETAPAPPAVPATGEPDRTSPPFGGSHSEAEPPDEGEHDHATPQYVVHFPLNSHIPLQADEGVLEQAARYLAEHPELPIEIEGHTCQLGSAAYNQELGQRRARAIQAYLESVDISPERFVRITSYGSHRLACSGHGEDCLRQNRRAVIVVVITPEK